MNRKLVGVLGAVLLAAVGTLLLVSFVKGAESRALAGERLAPVYVVSEDIPAGTEGEAVRPKLRLEQVPLKVQAAGAVRDLNELSGKVATVDLVAGEQLVTARFASPEEGAIGQVEVPSGLLETTIALEPQRAVGGQIRAGDTVALTASFNPFDLEGVIAENGEEVPVGKAKTGNTTHIILHKVLVTSVQGAPDAPQPAEGGEEAAAPTPSNDLLVTLALDAPSVERVVFAAEFGLVWLSAEPEDAPEDGTKVQTRGSIYGDDE